MSGASGAPYAIRLLQQLLAADCRVYLLLSSAAEVVIRQETDLDLPEGLEQQQAFFCRHFAVDASRLQLFDRRDWYAPVASGSAPIDAMVVCPASGGTLSALATGASNNLLERAGDVALKERKPLILVPREAPYSQVYLQNMLTLTQMGAIIVPASPGFYQRPTSVDDLVDFIVARILSLLGIPQQLLQPWGERSDKG